jgi:hypothetical protein
VDNREFLKPAFLVQLAQKNLDYACPALCRSKDGNLLPVDLPGTDSLVPWLYLYKYLKLGVQRGDVPPPEPGPFFTKFEALISELFSHLLRRGDLKTACHFIRKAQRFEKELIGENVNWRFLTGIYVSSSLWLGIVPTKKKIRERVIAKVGPKRTIFPTKRHWARIFRDFRAERFARSTYASILTYI